MNNSDKKWFIRGILIISVPLIVIIAMILTISFPDFFLKYSGVFTFYSLAAAITLFLIDWIFKIIKERDNRNSILNNIEEERISVESQLDLFKDSFIESLSQFNSSLFQSLPPEINGRSTSRLKRIIFSANFKINIINEIRGRIVGLIWNKEEKEIKRMFERPVVSEELEDIDYKIEEIKQDLKDLESCIKSLLT